MTRVQFHMIGDAMSPRNTFSVAVVMFLSLSGWAAASQQVGTITQMEGEVKIFSHPGKKIQGPAPHALFEGEYYSVQDAKIGARLENGNILRTAPGSKARIVFENGDQYNVSSGTAYRVFWSKDAAKTDTKVQLMYGKLRGVVEKGGPRGRLKVRTRSATMGVRGTDFFIADGGPEGGTEVTILRGEVEVKPEAPKAKPIEVKAGFSAEIPPPAVTEKEAGKETAIKEAAQPARVSPSVEIRKSTQEDLLAIQKSSEVKPMSKDGDRQVAEVPTEIKEKIQKLESKAVETTLKDIKAYDPKLYAQIQAQAVQSTDQLNQRAVEVLLKDAPKAPSKRKPFRSELEDLENGAYEKYFKIVD